MSDECGKGTQRQQYSIYFKKSDFRILLKNIFEYSIFKNFEIEKNVSNAEAPYEYNTKQQQKWLHLASFSTSTRGSSRFFTGIAIFLQYSLHTRTVYCLACIERERL